MSYFDDVLDASFKKMGVEADEPGKLDDPKWVAFKAKSAAGGANIASAFDMSEKGGEWKFGSKVEVSQTYFEEHAKKLIVKNKEYQSDWKWTPADFNKDGKDLSISTESKCNPAGKKGVETEVKAKLSVGGYGNDSVKAWGDVELQTDLSTLQTSTESVNLAIKNEDQTYHAGAKVVWNFKDKKIDDAYGQVVASGFKWGEAWVRSALLGGKGQFMSAGVCLNEDKNQVMTAEVSWDRQNKFKGFQGMPLLMNFAMAWKFSNGARYTSRLLLKDKWMAVAKLESPVVDGVKVTSNFNADVQKMLFSPKDFLMKTGFEVELKM